MEVRTMKKPAKKTSAPTAGRYCWLKDDLLTGALVCEQTSRWMKGIVASGGERVTPRVIAARLDKLGIKGEPGNERECPLARALANHLADFFGWDLVVSVNTEGAFMGLPFYADDGQMNYMLLCVPLPDVLVKFLISFDNGSFCKVRAIGKVMP
jgi:hypothetical protein